MKNLENDFDMKENKKKKISYLIHFVAYFSSALLATFCILSELIYPQIDEFSNLPFYFKFFIIFFLTLILISTILSIFFRTKKYTSKYELINELILIFLGLIGIFFSLYRKDSNVKDTIILIGTFMFILGFFPLFSTLIGLFKGEKAETKGQNDFQLDKKEIKEDSLNSNNVKSYIKIIQIISLTISTFSILFGIIFDIIILFLKKLGNSKDSFVGKYTLIGLLISVVVILISRLIMIPLKRKELENK